MIEICGFGIVLHCRGAWFTRESQRLYRDALAATGIGSGQWKQLTSSRCSSLANHSGLCYTYRGSSPEDSLNEFHTCDTTTLRLMCMANRRLGGTHQSYKLEGRHLSRRSNVSWLSDSSRSTRQAVTVCSCCRDLKFMMITLTETTGGRLLRAGGVDVNHADQEDLSDSDLGLREGT